jgi:hypothetical protein
MLKLPGLVLLLLLLSLCACEISPDQVKFVGEQDPPPNLLDVAKVTDDETTASQ